MTIKGLVRTAHHIEKPAEPDDLHEIKSLAKKIGTNRRLRAKAVSLDFQKPYDLVLK